MVGIGAGSDPDGFLKTFTSYPPVGAVNLSPVTGFVYSVKAVFTGVPGGGGVSHDGMFCPIGLPNLSSIVLPYQNISISIICRTVGKVTYRGLSGLLARHINV